MLCNLGWTPGTGLGKSAQGILTPILPFLQTNPFPLYVIASNILYYKNSEPSYLRLLAISQFKTDETSDNLRLIPEIDAKIDSFDTTALLDSGSEVSCINEDTYNAVVKNNNMFPTFPVKGIHLRGAIGPRSPRITLQAYIPLKIEQNTFEVAALVVKNLVKPLILGADWLTLHKATISYETVTITLIQHNNNITIPFKTVHKVQNQQLLPDIINCETLICTIEENPTSNKITENEEEIKEALDRTSLKDEQKKQLHSLLYTHRTVFSAKPGLSNAYEHQIQLHTDQPFIKRQYPIPVSLRPDVEKTLREMENDGIIERASSPYASPITIAKKKDGSIRICLDARNVNQLMLADSEAPEHVNDLLQRFAGCTYFSLIDLRMGFWQIPLHPESRKYTAFLYNGKSYVFKVMPFGIKTGIAAFTRAMDLVLGPEVREYAVNYVDDLLVASPTFEQHLKHIDTVLTKLQNANMTVNIEKTNFCKSEIKFLGHILTGKGLQPDPSKIEAIRNFPAPQNVK